MAYIFERRVGFRWEPLGVAEARAGEAVRSALTGPNAHPDGELPSGEYRFLDSTDGSGRWRYLALAEDGQMAVWAQG